MGMMLLDPESEYVRQMVARLNHDTAAINSLAPLNWGEVKDAEAGEGIRVDGVTLFHPGGHRSARLILAQRLRATADELEAQWSEK